MLVWQSMSKNTNKIVKLWTLSFMCFTQSSAVNVKKVTNQASISHEI